MGEINMNMDTKTLTNIMGELAAAKEADKDFHPPPIPLSPSQKWAKKWASQIKETWWQAEIVSAEHIPGSGGDGSFWCGKVKLIGTGIEVEFGADVPGLMPVWWTTLDVTFLNSIVGIPPEKSEYGGYNWTTCDPSHWIGKQIAIMLTLDASNKRLHVCDVDRLGTNTA